MMTRSNVGWPSINARISAPGLPGVIEVGYGLEDKVLDAIASRIINDTSEAIVSVDAHQRIVNYLAASSLFENVDAQQDGGKLRKLAEVIARSLGRAELLIQDLLDISGIEGGRLAIERVPLRPEEVIDEILAAVAPTASSASLEIGADIRRPLPRVMADRNRLSQVFSNLVGNALKFTPAGGRIVIGAERDDGRVRFWVRDTGIGIALEDIPHLFGCTSSKES